LYVDVTGTIYRLSLVGGKKAYVSGVGSPGEIAVDWITQNVYYVEKSRPQKIRVCNLDEKHCAKVITVEHDYTVTKLAVDPIAG
jgi:hypothetical protein